MLPADIYWEILPHCERSELYACTLVNSQLSGIATPFLYAFIRIDDDRSGAELVRTLTTKPSYTQHVRELRCFMTWAKDFLHDAFTAVPPSGWTNLTHVAIEIGVIPFMPIADIETLHPLPALASLTLKFASDNALDEVSAYLCIQEGGVSAATPIMSLLASPHTPCHFAPALTRFAVTADAGDGLLRIASVIGQSLTMVDLSGMSFARELDMQSFSPALLASLPALAELRFSLLRDLYRFYQPCGALQARSIVLLDWYYGDDAARFYDFLSVRAARPCTVSVGVSQASEEDQLCAAFEAGGADMTLVTFVQGSSAEFEYQPWDI
uniref:F-box domain-containing protein n=1 Tax=Mycena chlorophos TaxID=658473 RepID=A0ABQ0LY64_MYCCL|nr:predicted protein [Mycena chlorophos]